MIYLDEILNPEDLTKEIEAGYVRERLHPLDPSYAIYNYTEKAQYERRWNDITKACRGLITRDSKFGEQVIARPWAKFFNYGEHDEGSLDLNASVEVLDKADGSLGILYAGPDGWAIATRGSFESEQAIRATAWMRDFMAKHDWMPRGGFTYLFEIVYPGNRIVLDYGDRDELILLGAVEKSTGRTLGPIGLPWPGARVDKFVTGNATLREALALPPRPNAEGLVIRFLDSGLMVKVKQEDYLRLHKLVTGLSERAIWEHLNEHDNIGSLLEQIPDEFHRWVLDVADGLLKAHTDIYACALADYYNVLNRLPEDFERPEYASLAKESRYPGLMFMLLDGKDTGPAIYKMIRPVGHRPMTNRTEDEA